jgi:hypothetical protein
MTVGNHPTVKTRPGTHKAMKTAARRIPRRTPPPVTAHVLMVKTTVTHRSAPGKEKNFGYDRGLAFCQEHAQHDHDWKMLTIRISHGTFVRDTVDTYIEPFQFDAMCL